MDKFPFELIFGKEIRSMEEGWKNKTDALNGLNNVLKLKYLKLKFILRKNFCVLKLS